MPPKKKPARAAEAEQEKLEEFLKAYNRNQKEHDTPKLMRVQEILALKEAGEEVKCWNFDSEFDTMAFRILFHTLRQTTFHDIEAIRVWKCNGGDESVRSVCHYLETDPEPQTKDLHFTDNGVTALGCEFLGRLLGPRGNKVVNLLRLDYNKFGAPGVEKLSAGLSQNATLRQLSLQYCDIGEDGGQWLSHILIYCKSALEVLELKGNNLGNRGIVDVFCGAKRSKSLTYIDAFDNKFSDTPEVVKALRDLFAHNTNLSTFDLRCNNISDTGATQLVNGMIGYTHLQKVMVTERCSQKVFEALDSVLSSTKKKKKKGKKK